jgi:hypothetical protein
MSQIVSNVATAQRAPVYFCRHCEEHHDDRVRRSALARERRQSGLTRELSAVIVREGGRPSIPETAALEPRGLGVLDAPPARGMTIERT